MQLFDVYPAGTAGGCCFITKRYEVGPDEKVISLDVDLDSLPPHGLLCVSEEAVRQLNVILGWDADEHGRDRRRQLEERVAELEAELATFEEVRASLAPLISAPRFEESVKEVIDPAEHTVDEVVSWVEQNTDERGTVVALERRGKNRVTLIDKLEAM